MELSQNDTRRLGLFSLVMIAIVSVDSLRNLPVAAQYGFSLITFYFVAGVLFFFPLAWVTSKLAVKFPNIGGSYLWISNAFGYGYGHIAMLIQWLYNIIWYPTIFAFITATFASMFSHNLESNRSFILWASLILFWFLSIMHCRGIKTSSRLSAYSAIIGTLLPMVIMIVLAGFWLLSGKPSANPITWRAILPTLHDFHNIGFFSNILFSLIGLEVIAMHAGNVINPAKVYSKAVYLSAVIILFSIVFSSSSLCVIMPVAKLTLINGLSDVLRLFFAAHSIANVSILISLCIIIGGIGIASSWMLALARGLHVSMCDYGAPAWLQRLNKNHMPSGILFLQAIVYTVLTSAFSLFPNINSSYWMLSAIAAQFGLLYYILLFFAAIKLIRKDKFNLTNNILSILLPGMAIVVCFIGIIVGFVPPEIEDAGSQLTYQITLLSLFIFLGLVPFFKFIVKKRRLKS